MELRVNALVHRDFFVSATIRLFVFTDRGLGTGVPRTLGAWPKMDLLDEREANQFRAVVWRVVQASAPTSVETLVDTPQVAGQVTGQVTGQVWRLLSVMVAEHSRSELQALLGLKHRDSFMASYLQPALAAGWVEMTISDKPQSSKQRYRLTPAGKIALASLNKDTP